MSTATSISSSYKLEKLHVSPPSRTRSSVRTTHVPWISIARNGYCITGVNRRGRANRIISMDLNAVNNLPPGPPIPSGSPFPGWSNWMLLTIIPMIIPFFSGKWGPFIALKRRVDTAVETVQNLAETIEDVADMVDNMADEVTEKLPEGSKLRQIIERIDLVAEKTEKAADCAGDILQQVDEVGDKVETILKESHKSQARVAGMKKVVEQAEVATADAVAAAAAAAAKIEEKS